MTFTPHEALIERIDKWIHPDSWNDINLYSVLYEKDTGIEPCLENIEYWEVPGLAKPNITDIINRANSHSHGDENDMTIRDGDLDRPELYLRGHDMMSRSPHAPDSPANPAWPESPGRISASASPGTSNIRFRPLKDRQEGKVFGPSWSTKWFRLTMKFSKNKLRHYRERLALKWDSNCEALLYTSKGNPVSAYTGGTWVDRRDLAFLLSSLPEIKNTAVSRTSSSPTSYVDGTSAASGYMSNDSLGDGALAHVDLSDSVFAEYYIEMACNGMFGNGGKGLIAAPDPKRTFKLESCELVVVNELAHALYWDMLVLRDVAKQLSDNPVGIEAANIATAIINTTDIHSAVSLQNARKRIREHGMFSDVLATSDSFSLTRSVTLPGKMHSKSYPARDLPQKSYKLDHTVVAVGHCHIDTAWLWPFSETRRKVVRSWVTQMELLNFRRNREKHIRKSSRKNSKSKAAQSAIDDLQCNSLQWNFAASQAVQYEWLREDHPNVFARLCKEVKTGKFIPIGGAYTEFDANMPSGESMIRQFLYGIQFFESAFGADSAKENKTGKAGMEAEHATTSAIDTANESDSSSDNGEGYSEVLIGTPSKQKSNANTTLNRSPADVSKSRRGAAGDTKRSKSPISKKGGTSNASKKIPRYAADTQSSRGRSVSKKENFESEGFSWCPSKVFWLPDTFGYSGNLPQIMQGFEIPYFLSQKLSWNLTVKFHHTTFLWEGIDGSTVLAHFPPADTYNSDCSVAEVLKCVKNHKSLAHSKRSLLLFGHGDGGGGPATSHLEQLQRVQQCKGMPTIETKLTPTEFFADVEEEIGVRVDHSSSYTGKIGAPKPFSLPQPTPPPPRWVGELYLELHQGTLTSQANIKKQNRQCENRLRTLEALLVYAAYGLSALPAPDATVTNGGRGVRSPSRASSSIFTPEKTKITVETGPKKVDKDFLNAIRDEIRILWKTVLLCQFHDVLPGSSIGQVYSDTNDLLSQVLNKSWLLCQQLMEIVLPAYHSSASTSFILTNIVPSSVLKHIAFNGTGFARDDYYRSTGVHGCIDSFAFTASAPQHDNVVESLPEKTSDLLNFSIRDAHLMNVSSLERSIPDSVNDSIVASVTDDCVSGDETAYGYSMENKYIKVQISTRGLLLSLVDKRISPHRECLSQIGDAFVNQMSPESGADDNTGEEAGRGIANCLTVHEDVPFFWDAWDVMPYHAQTGYSLNHNHQSSSPMEEGARDASTQITDEVEEERTPNNSPPRGKRRGKKKKDSTFSDDGNDDDNGNDTDDDKSQFVDTDAALNPGESSRLLINEDSQSVCVEIVLVIFNRNRTKPAGVIRQTITLFADSPELCFHSEVDWQAQNQILKVSFPLALHTRNAIYEIQNGLMQRPTHGNTQFDNSMYEVCAQRFACLAEPDYGVALLNDCKYGHSCRASTLSLSLLRSPKSPDNFCDMGKHEFTYVLLPYIGASVSGIVGNTETQRHSPVQAATRLNSPLIFRDAVSELTPGLRSVVEKIPYTALEGPSLAKIISDGVSSSGCSLAIDSIKLAEDDLDVIIRLVETSGCSGTGFVCMHPGMHVAGAREVNMAEKELPGDRTMCATLVDGLIQVRYTPFKIITVRITLHVQ